MNWLRASILVTLTVFGQVFFAGWKPFGVVPAFALVVVLLAGLWRPASEAVAIAALSGFILDFLSGHDFGLRTAFYSLAALIIVLLVRNGMEMAKYLTIGVLVIVLTALWYGVVVGASVAAGGALGLGGVMKLMIVEVPLNLVLAGSMITILQRFLANTESTLGSYDG